MFLARMSRRGPVCVQRSFGCKVTTWQCSSTSVHQYRIYTVGLINNSLRDCAAYHPGPGDAGADPGNSLGSRRDGNIKKSRGQLDSCRESQSFKIARVSRVRALKIFKPVPPPDHSRVRGSRLSGLWMDCFECMALQSLQLRFCCGQFRFSQHLWRPQDAGRFPIDRSLHGNKVALRGSMGQCSGHVVCVARLIEANVPDGVIRVPEVDKHETAYCHDL